MLGAQVFNKWVTLEDKPWMTGAIKELCTCNIVSNLAKQVSTMLLTPAGHQGTRHGHDHLVSICNNSWQLTLNTSACPCLNHCTAWQRQSLSLRS